MPIDTYDAWLTLYVGVGIVVALCVAASILKTAWDYHSGPYSVPFGSWSERALAPAKVWWRWQVNYLTGAPVILLVAGLYAHYLGFSVLLDV